MNRKNPIRYTSDLFDEDRNDKFCYWRPYVKIKDDVLLSYIPDESGNVNIPKGVVKIAEGIFDWRNIPSNAIEDFEDENPMQISRIYIPSSVETIEAGAFYYCKGLKTILVDQGNKNFKISGGALYNSDMSELICYPAVRSEGKKYRIPQSVRIIDDFAFADCEFDELILPDHLEIIGELAFSYCRGLHDIKIPNSLRKLGENAFGGSDAVVTADKECSVLTVNDYGILSKDGKVLIKAAIPENGCYCVPNGVTEIEESAFSRCNVKSVTIPEGVSAIPSRLFKWQIYLEKVILPDSVSFIGWDAFTSCTSLTHIRMPKEVDTIQPYAFNGCKSLETIELTGDPYVGENAFMNCNKLTFKVSEGSDFEKYCKENNLKYIEA